MPNLFGAEYSPDELRRLTSTMRQIAGIRMVELAEGKARGLRVAEVYTGSGLRFQVFLDRAMDIGAADFAGTPIAWVHPALGTPGQYEPQGYGWSRTWGGGLVTTCGLTFFGQPEDDAGEHLGLHGRISHIPAEQLRLTEEWRGDDYVLEIEGQVRQSVLFGENVLLTRKISTHMGATSLTIEDRVRNDGFRDKPHMILYHCNFGFPVVSPDSEILLDDEYVNARDEAARRGLENHRRFEQPQADYAEQVFFHKPRVGEDGYVRTAIVNRRIGFGAYLRYRAAELPCLAQWKMMGQGEYVCALEPANQWETPRRKLREEGRLKLLAPGEEMNYRLELGVLPDAQAVEEFLATKDERRRTNDEGQ
jgi:Domain of unknown function (DUF4432)